MAKYHGNVNEFENDENIYSNIDVNTTTDTLTEDISGGYESLQIPPVPVITKFGGKEIGTKTYRWKYIVVIGAALIIGAVVAGGSVFVVTKSEGPAAEENPEGTSTPWSLKKCLSSPCLNLGICSDISDGFLCTCLPGYQGALCETEINECASDPCVDGGSCKDKLNGYVCVCQSGYGGATCETEINECASNPCGVGEYCHDNLDSYTCSCLDGSDKCDENAALCPAAFTIKDPTRSICNGQERKCDVYSNITQGKWYKFVGKGDENLVIPEYPPGEKKCGTAFSGWLNSSHPTGYEPVARTVCYESSWNTCDLSIQIQIKRCDGFFIYQLYFPNSCYYRICTASITYRGRDMIECS